MFPHLRCSITQPWKWFNRFKGYKSLVPSTPKMSLLLLQLSYSFTFTHRYNPATDLHFYNRLCCLLELLEGCHKPRIMPCRMAKIVLIITKIWKQYLSSHLQQDLNLIITNTKVTTKPGTEQKKPIIIYNHLCQHADGLQGNNVVHSKNCQQCWVSNSMGLCKKDVTPLLTHWSYVFLALTHRIKPQICFIT